MGAQHSVEAAYRGDGEVLLDTHDGFAVVTLNRPHRRNALTFSVLDAVVAAFGDAVRRGDRAVILAGSPPSFCAGWDLDDLASVPADGGADLSRRIQAGLYAIETTPIPVLAAVEGAARGGGCGLACAADIRILGSGATIGVPEVAIGTIPGGGIIRRLAALVGPGVAAELLFTAAPVSSDRALALGLANHVVDDGSALAAAIDMAKQIAAQPPAAVAAAKRVLAAAPTVTPDELVDRAAAEIEFLVRQRNIGPADAASGRGVGQSARGVRP